MSRTKRALRALHHTFARWRWQWVDRFDRRRELPPGSLSLSALSDLHTRDFYLEKIRRYGPVFKMFWGSGHLKICVSGFARAKRLLLRHKDLLAPVNLDITSVTPKGFLRCMRGDDHSKYRRVLAGLMPAELLDERGHTLRSVIARELSGLAERRPRQSPASSDLVEALDRIATESLFGIFYGVTQDEPDFEPLARAHHRLGPTSIVNPLGQEQREAFETIHEIIAALIDKASLARPGRDSVCALLSRDRDHVSDANVTGNIIYMVEMGRHDLRGLFRWIVKYLAEHPSVVRELRTTEGSHERRRFAQACVHETLRLDQAEGLNRRAMAEVEIDGLRIPERSDVTVLLRETHRDPAIFSEPDQFEPRRFLDRSYSLDEYAPFGLGEHRCLAEAIVVELSSMFVDELVFHYDCSVSSDGPPYRGTYHWEPSPTFSIALTPCDATPPRIGD